MLQSWGEQGRLAQHFRKSISACCDAPINSLFFESQGRPSRRNTGISPLLTTDHEIFRLTWVLLPHDEPWSLPIAPGTISPLRNVHHYTGSGLVHTAQDGKGTGTKAKY